MNDKIMLIESYNFWVPRKIDILGTTYEIILVHVSQNPDNIYSKMLSRRDYAAYCSPHEHKIIVGDFTDKTYFPGYDNNTDEVLVDAYKEVLRHEIIHAFFACSGLKNNSHPTSSFATDEELVDFIAIQSPKIFKVFNECNLL